MDSNEFLNLIEQLPEWATDSTLMNLVTTEGRSLDDHMREVNKVAKSLGLKEVQVNIHDFIGQKKRENTKIDKFLAGVRREVDDALSIRATDPIRGFSEIAELGGRMFAGAGEKVDDYASNFNTKWSKALKAGGTTAKYAGKAITGMAAFGGALAPIIMGQERNLRAMLDYGMMFENGLDGATEMRGAAADLGMSVQEMLKANDSMRHVFVNQENGIASGALAFNKFTANLASQSRNDQGFSQFGLIGTKFQEEMGNVTKMFFELGEQTVLNQHTRKRIKETFTNTQKIALAMAELTGVNRNEMIQSGLDAQGREESRLSLLRNKNLLEEKYGDGSTVQMQLNADFINGMVKQMLPDFADGIDETISGVFRMLPETENVLMSIPQGLNEALAVGGSGVTNSFVYLIEGIKDRVDRKELALRFRDFAKTAKNMQTVPAVGDETLDSANKLKNLASVIPTTFMDATDSQIMDTIEKATAAAEAADDSIETVESVKVGMRKLQDQVVPGYKKLGGIFATTTEDLKVFKNFLQDAGFIKKINDTSVTDRLLKNQQGNVSPYSEDGKKIIAKEGGYGGVFDPQTGVTIADDQIVPPRLSDGTRGTLTGPAPSKDPTIEMAPAEVPPVRPGDRVHQIQNKTAAVRKGPLADALVTILKNAAIVTDPNLRVEVTSGGQMPLEEWKQLPTSQTTQKGNKYFHKGKVVRTGSRRHDDGMAADLQLRLGDHLIPYTHPKFLQFTEAFFALGGRAGSADHDYMGKHRGHFDIVGTDKGGGTRWNASASFAQAQDSGLIMASRPEANPYLKRLQEIQASENAPVNTETKTIATSKITDSNQSVNTSDSNVTAPNDNDDRLNNIEQMIASEQDKINRSNSGENVYPGLDRFGRQNSKELIEKLKKELQEMVVITQQHKTDSIVQGAQ